MKWMIWFKSLSRGVQIGMIAGLVLLVGLVLATSAGVFGRDEGISAMPTFVVQRGALTINVLETGTIKPRQQEIIKSDVEGNNTIIYLVSEGTLVKQDDLLVQLDASKLEENLLNQQITVRNAEASFIRAREQFSMTQTQTEIDVTRAKLDYQFAQEDLANYVDGEYPKLLMEADNRITLAREQMEQSREKLRWSEKLFEEKYISQTEFESDRLALQRSKLDYDLAVSNKDLLERFTRIRKLNSLTTNVDQMKRALDKALSKANADIVQAEADLRARQAEFDRQKQRLEKIEKQITKTKITAPRAGMVVYATSAQGGGFRGNVEPLAEGQQVRERQELIYLPTAAEFDVELKIHESSLEKVRLGQPVRITVDALPGEVFTGRVSRIAPLPDATSVWLNPDLKVYTTTVQIDGDHMNLRTGMNSRSEVIIEQYEDAVYIPVQSVLRVNGKPTVWVPVGSRLEARGVKIGLDNNRMIHVLEGLSAGERVSLSPPLSAAGATEMAAATGAGGNHASAVVRTPSANPVNGSATGQTTGNPPSAGNGGATPVNQQGASGQPAATVSNATAVSNPPQAAATQTGATSPAGEQPNMGQQQGNRAERAANMSEEQRAALRRQFENMTPEQRDAIRQQMRRQREQQNGEGGTTPGSPAPPANPPQAVPSAPRGEGQ